MNRYDNGKQLYPIMVTYILEEMSVLFQYCVFEYISHILIVIYAKILN